MSDFHMKEIIGTPIYAVNRETEAVQHQNSNIDESDCDAMGTLGSRLRECRAESALTQKEVCTRTGIKQGTLSELENDKYPTSSFVPHLASLYRVEALWLAEGKGVKRRSDSALVTPGDGRLPIRRGLFKLSAGVSGYEVEYENGESEPIFMAKRWFDHHHYNPERLIALKVNGRSMEPKMHDGDLVIVDMDSATPKDGVVFAVNYEGEMVIKRMRRDAGQWFITSDNPDKTRYADKVCAEACFILGEVIYLQTETI